MKLFLLTAAFAILFMNVNAQKMKASEVPSAVTTKFTSTYPKAEHPKWEKEGNNYEAEFEFNEVEMSALFDANGTIVETEVEIKVSELPKAVTDYMAKNVAGSKIREASKITDAAGKITYEAEANKKNYIFDSEGTFIKTVEGD